jgi:hypothetical protein
MGELRSQVFLPAVDFQIQRSNIFRRHLRRHHRQTFLLLHHQRLVGAKNFPLLDRDARNRFAEK